MLQWALLGLEGFRVIGRRTYSFYAWSLVNFVGFAFVIAPAVFAGGSLGSGRDPRLWPLRDLALIVVGPLLGSVLACATFRSILNPEASRFAYLRLGRAEASVAVLVLLAQAALAGVMTTAVFAGPWAVLAGLAAIALWACATFIGPALVRGEAAPFKTAWRLARLHYRGVLLMSLVAVAICTVMGLTILSLWMYVMPRLVRSAATTAELLRIAFPALAPLMMAWTGVLVVAAAPAAAAYSKLAEPEAVAKAKAFA